MECLNFHLVCPHGVGCLEISFHYNSCLNSNIEPVEFFVSFVVAIQEMHQKTTKSTGYFLYVRNKRAPLVRETAPIQLTPTLSGWVEFLSHIQGSVTGLSSFPFIALRSCGCVCTRVCFMLQSTRLYYLSFS